MTNLLPVLTAGLANARHGTSLLAAAQNAATAVRVPLSRRIAAVLEEGVHPATGQPIVTAETCGSCINWRRQTRPRGVARTKCALSAFPRLGPNLPPATPACVLHLAAAPTAAIPPTPKEIR